MSLFGLCRVLLHMFCNYFTAKSVFFICDALLDVDHFLLGQGAAHHGEEGGRPPPPLGRPYLMATVIQKMPEV